MTKTEMAARMIQFHKRMGAPGNATMERSWARRPKADLQKQYDQMEIFALSKGIKF